MTQDVSQRQHSVNLGFRMRTLFGMPIEHRDFHLSTMINRNLRSWLLLSFCFLGSHSFQIAFPNLKKSKRSSQSEGFRASLDDFERQSSSPAWRCSISRVLNHEAALNDCLNQIASGDKKVNVCFMFMSLHHASKFRAILHLLENHFAKQHGTTVQTVVMVGGGVAGGEIEVNEATVPALSILGGYVDDIEKNLELTWYNELQNTPPSEGSLEWENINGALVFADPWSPFDQILQCLNGTPVAGGISLANGVQSTVALNGVALPQGSVVLAKLKHDLSLQVVTAQGCRPMGPICTVTGCENGSVVTHLDGQPAMDVLESLSHQVPTKDRLLLSRGPTGTGTLCGLADTKDNLDQDDTLSQSRKPDYLIRQMTGFIPAKRALIVGGGTDVKIGQLFQFHVRDKDSALQDWELATQRYQSERLFQSSMEGRTKVPFAALQFSCIARGDSLFRQANVDLRHVQGLVNQTSTYSPKPTRCPDDLAAESAVAGVFCNGEIGPKSLAGVTSEGSSRSFVHAFTVVAAILCYQVSSTEDPSVYHKAEDLIVGQQNVWE